MKKTTKNIIKYLIEFLIVAFGVFLGIYASEWENQKKISQGKENAIENIVRELKQNKENLQESIEYHELNYQRLKTDGFEIAQRRLVSCQVCCVG